MTASKVCANTRRLSRSRCTGKERDAESGLDNFGARYYGSNMGRFMSPDDDSDQESSDPQSWNLYAYVRNNPLTNTDPDGHDCVVQQRVDAHHETVSVTSGDCAGKGRGSGQSATYVPGTVTPGSISAGADGHSIDIGYTSYGGESSGVENSSSAPAFDHPGIDGPANAAIFGQIGNQGMGAVKWFGEQMVLNVAGGLAGHGVGLGFEALQATRAARAAQAIAIAERVTQHAFGKHAGEFNNISRNEFQSLVQETVANPSEVRSLSNGRTAYWSDSQQMMVIENSTAPSRSTAFRPTSGKSYFDNDLR